MSEECVAIIGAGAVGCVAAIYAARLGYQVILIEAASEILQGATSVATIAHFSGSEYPLDPSLKTGKDCVFGGVLSKLIFPDSIYTNVVNQSYPIRFLLSKSTEEKGILTRTRFQDHAECMRSYYRKLFNELQSINKWSWDETAHILHGDPEEFIKELNQKQYSDLSGIVYGHSACGQGVNMPVYAALISNLLTQSGVKILTSCEVRKIEPFKKGYKISCKDSARSICVDQVAMAASYDGIKLIADLAPKFRNSYNIYLNIACYAALDPSIKTGITFTLLGENGGMFAPLAYAQAGNQGLASLYLPASFGSQYDVCKLDTQDRQFLLPNWDLLMSDETIGELRRGEEIRNHLESLYPFLNKTKIVRTRLNAVLNAASRREIRRGEHPYKIKDGLFLAFATKWTNAITTSLELVIEIQKQSLERGLISEDSLVFPHGKVDLAHITEKLSFKDETYLYSRALEFVKMWNFPEQMLRTENSQSS